MAPVKSSDIQNALKLRFPALSHALMFEVAPATGGGTRYADAVAVGLWASHGHMVQGVEIKVSRSDFLHEMKQPQKSDPVMRYCNRWWLACPKGMVKPEELPTTWGMLEYHDRGVLQVKVKAPVLPAIPVTLAFFASLCRRRAGRDEAMSDEEIARQVAQQVDSHKKRLDGEHANKLGYRQTAILEAEAKLNAIKAATGVDLEAYKADDDIIRAIQFYVAAERKLGWHGEFLRLRDSLKKAVQALDDAGMKAEESAATT